MGIIEAGISAYLADIDKFKKEFKSEYANLNFIQGCICRGCAYSLDFSKYILSLDIFSYNIYKVCVSCLIMNNIINEVLIEKYKPFCIWYPIIPSKETSLRLPKSLKYSVAILSILMNWEDVYNSLDIENDSYIGRLIKYFNRTFKFNYINTKNLVDLANENILDESSSDEFYFSNILEFEQYDSEYSILDFSSEESINFIYIYPLGLSVVSAWNLDKYILNKDIKYYIFIDDDELKLRDGCYDDYSE